MLTLKKNYEFQNVFNKGKWYGGDLITIYVYDTLTDEPNKLGFAVGKKVAKSVKRNRIRRVIREAYRLNEYRIFKGKNIVIVWKNGIDSSKATFEDVQADLLKCLKKADLLIE